MAAGWIAIDGILFKCVIGVLERERRMRQDVVANVRVRMDFGKATASDSIHDTVDYRQIVRVVVGAGERSEFQLLESLAAHLARTVLDEFPAVQAVRTEVEKVGALTAARSVKAIVTARRAR